MFADADSLLKRRRDGWAAGMLGVACLASGGDAHGAELSTSAARFALAFRAADASSADAAAAAAAAPAAATSPPAGAAAVATSALCIRCRRMRSLCCWTSRFACASCTASCLRRGAASYAHSRGVAAAELARRRLRRP